MASVSIRARLIAARCICILALAAFAGACASGPRRPPVGAEEPDKVLWEHGMEALQNRRWFVAREFLTPAECAGLIRLIDAERIPSQLLAPTPDPEFRTSESCNLSPFEPIVKQVEDKINGLLGIDPLNGETVQGAAAGRYETFRSFVTPRGHGAI